MASFSDRLHGEPFDDEEEPVIEDHPDAEDPDDPFGIASSSEDLLRAKGQMDGAKTLSEAAALLRDYADILIKYEAQGWQLTQPVEDDYGFIERGEASNG